MDQKRLKGAACFFLPDGVVRNVRAEWKGAGQFDWLVATADDVVATETLGEVKLHGIKCIAYLCDDGRARAIPVLP